VQNYLLTRFAAGGRISRRRRRAPPENSIIPHAALFVKRKTAQSSRRKDPEISAKLPLDFFKKFYYNYYTR